MRRSLIKEFGVSCGKAQPFRTSGGKAANAMREPKRIDPLPELFETEESAGEFWDTHSVADYKEHFETVNGVTFEITERVFEVQVAEDVYRKLQEQAAALHQPVPNFL